MAIVGLDIGNITTVAVSELREIILESRLSKATDINKLGAEEIFTFEEVEYVANSGLFENNLIKHEKENFVTLMYYAISKATSSNKIQLFTGIPASQYNIKRKELEEFIKANSSKTIKVDGITRTIEIDQVHVVPEGYNIKTLRDIVNKCIPGLKILAIDIGGGTTDIAEFDANWKFTGGESIRYGLLDLYREARRYINDTYNLNVSLEESKAYFDGKLDLINGDIAYKNAIMKEFIRNIVNELRGIYQNLSNTNLILAGGGGQKIEPTFTKLYNQTILAQGIGTTARGFYNIGVKKNG